MRKIKLPRDAVECVQHNAWVEGFLLVDGMTYGEYYDDMNDDSLPCGCCSCCGCSCYYDEIDDDWDYDDEDQTVPERFYEYLDMFEEEHGHAGAFEMMIEDAMRDDSVDDFKEFIDEAYAEYEKWKEGNR